MPYDLATPQSFQELTIMANHWLSNILEYNCLFFLKLTYNHDQCEEEEEHGAGITHRGEHDAQQTHEPHHKLPVEMEAETTEKWILTLLVLKNEYDYKADSRFVPSQWETALLCNDVSHWLGASLESA